MIVQALCISFKLELLQAIHDFTADTFKLALYGSSANISGDTTAYTATGEIAGTGYTAGGLTLTKLTPVISSGVAIMSFSPAEWTSAAFDGVYGGMIYNSSKANRSVLTLNFGTERAAANDVFTVTFPDFSSSSAIIRIQ